VLSLSLRWFFTHEQQTAQYLYKKLTWLGSLSIRPVYPKLIKSQQISTPFAKCKRMKEMKEANILGAVHSWMSESSAWSYKAISKENINRCLLMLMTMLMSWVNIIFQDQCLFTQRRPKMHYWQHIANSEKVTVRNEREGRSSKPTKTTKIIIREYTKANKQWSKLWTRNCN